MDELTIITAAADLPRVGGGVVLGIGDDGAVVTPAQGYEVLATDTLAEGTHFKRGWTSPEDLGWKSLAVNVSDLAAMGAKPRHALLSLAVPGDVGDGWIRAYLHGLGDACRQWQIPLIGGDTVRAPAIVITVTVTGETQRPLYRAGAQPGWLLAVTGELGGAAAGLAMVQQGRCEPQAALARWRRPQARLAAGMALSRSGLPVSVADCSDGLVTSCDLLAGNWGYDLVAEALPIDGAALKAADTREQAESWALQGGEDFELVLAFPAAQETAIRQAIAPLALTVVGQVSAAPGRGLLRGGRRGLLAGGGFRHF